jgi:putative membrane protein
MVRIAMSAQERDRSETGDATRRTHLANERTQLAWWRTGLTAVAVGIGIGRVVPELGGGTRWPYAVIGAAYVAYGIAFTLVGARRHREVESAILEARFRRQDERILLALTVAGVLLALATGVVIVVDP